MKNSLGFVAAAAVLATEACGPSLVDTRFSPYNNHLFEDRVGENRYDSFIDRFALENALDGLENVRSERGGMQWRIDWTADKVVRQVACAEAKDPALALRAATRGALYDLVQQGCYSDLEARSTISSEDQSSPFPTYTVHQQVDCERTAKVAQTSVAESVKGAVACVQVESPKPNSEKIESRLK